MTGRSAQVGGSPRAASARRRREWHEQQIAAATTWKQRIHKLASWLVAEARQESDAGREQVEARMAALVRELNERNGS